MRVTESDTNLRGCEALARKLDDVLNDVLWRRFQPRWWGTTVRKGRGCYGGLISDKTKARDVHQTYKCPFREHAYDPWWF